MDRTRLAAIGLAVLCATTAVYLMGQRSAAVDVQRANDLGRERRYHAAVAAVAGVSGRPADLEARIVRGRALLGLQRYAEADRQFAAALRAAPSNWQLHRDRAIALALGGRRAAAIDALSAALALNPRMRLPEGVTVSGLAREPR